MAEMRVWAMTNAEAHPSSKEVERLQWALERELMRLGGRGQWRGVKVPGQRQDSEYESPVVLASYRRHMCCLSPVEWQQRDTYACTAGTAVEWR